MQRLATTGAARGWRAVTATLAAAAVAVGLTSILQAQDSTSSTPAITPRAASDTAKGHGPTFFAVRSSDGEHVDARDAPALQRRVSLTLVGVPLGMAVQAIADRAGLETTINPQSIPLGARVSMKGDDVTVASALRWVLVNAPVDVLLQDDTHLTIVPRTNPAADEDSAGVLAGELVDNETDDPVPYGTVTLLGTDVGRFADRLGHFRMTRLLSRRYVLRARQIGYSPVDSTVAIARESTTNLTIRMRRVPAMLSLVRVNGHRRKECVATGIPDSTADPTLAAIFAQVRENVDRYNLLLERYPFRYAHEEQQLLQRPGSPDEIEFRDTLAFHSQQRRPYRAGDLIYHSSVVRQDSVFRDDSVPGARVRVFVGMRTHVTARRRHMELPTFADLADPAFLATHCFEYSGTTDEGYARLIRVDFQPAKTIKTPDVSGSIYLDADSLVLRRAFFRLTRPDAAKPPVLGFSVTTTFREILPLVPVVASFESVQPVQGAITALGSDRLLSFEFEGRPPGEEATTLPQRAPVASAPGSGTATGGVRNAASTLTPDPDFTRLRAVFPVDPSCKPTLPADTISLILYGTLHGRRPRGLSDTAWSMYTSAVLGALSQSFALPEELTLTTFSWPFMHAVRPAAPRLAVVNVQGPTVGRPFVVPMISTSVALILGTDGSLKGVHPDASSASEIVDSLVLAAVRRASAADAFPRLAGTSDRRDSVALNLVVSITEPAPGDQVIALRRIDAPAWPSLSGAHLTAMPSLPTDLLRRLSMGVPVGDTAAIEFVVSDLGKPLAATAHLEYSGAWPPSADSHERDVERLVSMLSDPPYAAARVADCRVPEFVRQAFSYR